MRASVEPFGICHLSVLAGATANELKAYIAISSFQGGNDRAFPSLEELAKRATISVTACSQAISKLVRKGLIYRKRNYGASNTYVCTPMIQTIPEMRTENKRVKNLKNYSHSENHNNYENHNHDHSENHNIHHSENHNVEHSENRNDIVKQQIKQHSKTTGENNREPIARKTSDQLIEDAYTPPPQESTYIPDEKLTSIIDSWKKDIEGYKPAMLSREKQAIREALREGYKLEEIKGFLTNLKKLRNSKDKQFDIYKKNAFSFAFLMGKDHSGAMLGQLIGIIDSGSLPKDDQPGYSYEIWDDLTEEQIIERTIVDGKWNAKESDPPQECIFGADSEDGEVPPGSKLYPYTGIYIDPDGYAYRCSILREKYLRSIGKGHYFDRLKLKGARNVA